MKDTPYSKFYADTLILRDELAIDRTILANERTLLSYLRSAVALLIAGISIIHFSTESWFWMLGLTCIPTGIITGIIGVARYRRMNQSIVHIRKQSETETNQQNMNTEP
jgi:putative membrane protein